MLPMLKLDTNYGSHELFFFQYTQLKWTHVLQLYKVLSTQSIESNDWVLLDAQCLKMIRV